MRPRRRFERIDAGPYVTWWRRRYGLPDDHLDDHECYRRGKSSVWIAPRGVDIDRLPGVEGVGIPFLRIGSKLWKPSTVAVVAFAAGATRNVVDLRDDEIGKYLAAQSIRWDEGDRRTGTCDDGYVIVRGRGIPLGCALWRDWGIISAVPKGRRIEELDA